ncbi:MAG: LPS export ABC transporter periplasmic protein LptC [Ignavibacteria bacterium]|nr:LPS export ABC transporter periplasmic protein LptC [Ignavibacteria bacterium]
MKVAQLLILTLITIGCTPQDPIQRASEDPFLTAPLHLSFNVRVLFTDSARTKAVLNAGEAKVFEDRKQTLLGNHVHIEFFDKNTQRRVAELDSDSAEIDDRTKNMVAIGNVRVWSDSSRTLLNTTRLLWDEETQRISTNEIVHIVTPSETIDGKGLESDQFLSSYRIFKVRGVHRQ